MIPKGATIFFIVGVIGAGALGAYLSEISNQVPTLVYQNGPSLTVIPEKITYHLGEPVHIRIINSGTVSLTFSDSSYGLKILGLDGTIISSPVSAQVISTLQPKEEKTFVWDQTKTDGSKIFEGRYKIVSSTSPGEGTVLEKSVTINIMQWASGKSIKVTSNLSILKSEDGLPACVKPPTAQVLIERGWGSCPLRLGFVNRP